MIVDTSALAAILLREDDADTFAASVLSYPGGVSISAGSVIELMTVVVRRKDVEAMAEVEILLDTLGIDIASVDPSHVRVARNGFARYGKGTGAGRHGLNYGDCFAYALARSTGRPLLFKGSDFSQTDIVSATA